MNPHARDAAAPRPLTPIQKVVLLMHRQGKTQAEIGTVLNVSQQAVSRHLNRARRQLAGLRAALAARGDDVAAIDAAIASQLGPRQSNAAASRPPERL